MARLILALPFWAYIGLALAVVFYAETVTDSADQDQAARSSALAEGPPEPVPLGDLVPPSDVGQGGEVHVDALLRLGQRSDLARYAPGSSAPRFVFMLFAPGAQRGDRSVRAALLLTLEEQEAFLAKLGPGERARAREGTPVRINGLVERDENLLRMAHEAILESGLMATPDFFAIAPFPGGREAALAHDPATRPERKQQLYIVAGVIALLGFGRLLRQMHGEDESQAEMMRRVDAAVRMAREIPLPPGAGGKEDGSFWQNPPQDGDRPHGRTDDPEDRA